MYKYTEYMRPEFVHIGDSIIPRKDIETIGRKDDKTIWIDLKQRATSYIAFPDKQSCEIAFDKLVKELC